MRLSFFKLQTLFLRSSPNTNPTPEWLLLSRHICSPHHLNQFLSLSVVSGLLQSPRHLYVWNSLLHSLARTSSPELSVSLYDLLRRVGVVPDSYTFTSALKAIAHLSLPKRGEQLHSLCLKLGFESDTFVHNSLIHMYSACSLAGDARRIFDSAPDSARDVVSWNSMISGYMQSNLCEEALRLFGRMVAKSIAMDVITPVSALVACGRVGAPHLGRRIHGLITVNGFDLNYYLGSSLVSMYAKCGAVQDARKLFDAMPERNVVCWTSMISGYTQSGWFQESIELFREMQITTGVRADDATIASVVSSCAQLGALDQGRYVHAYCDINGIGIDLCVKNALIDMYSKCGDIERALQLFQGLVHPDVFSWTVMISGLAMNGNSDEALNLFSQMEASGKVMPNGVTFLGVLSACSHGGLVTEGYLYFDRMARVYKLTPRVEHYGCMVDLFGRAKLLAVAERFIKEMPIEPDVVIWRSLLFACRVNGDAKRAEYAAERILELEPRQCGAHVLLSNVYAGASRWIDVNRVRRGMIDLRIQKQRGCSFIEVDGVVHEFLVADTSHDQIRVIHGLLWEINRFLLSEPCSSDIVRSICETQDENKSNCNQGMSSA